MRHVVVVILLTLLNTLPAVNQGLQRLAIVRPFAPTDVFRLSKSFGSWNTYLPCLPGDDAAAVEIDFYLCFSQSLVLHPEAQATVQSLLDDFASNTEPWHSCFSNFYGVDTGLHADNDRYITDADNGSNTAEGPNLQFIGIAQNFVSGIWGDRPYGSFMLMEMDTVPIRRGWLAAILEELNANAPYAVYGSNYRGNRWDAFYTEMSPAIKFHINGNAVYNYSSPEFLALLSNVSARAMAGKNAMAYDLLMASLVLRDVADPAVPASQTTSHESETLPPTAAPTAARVAPQMTYVDMYKPTASFISNYAHMTMVPKFFGEEYLVHGANMAFECDPSLCSVALVVSDWGNEPELNILLDSLRTGDHPFREVIIYRPPANMPSEAQSVEPIIINGTEVAHMTVRHAPRTDAAYNDWCNANVTSTWLAYTNIYFSIRNPARIARTGSGQPILHYLSPRHCREYRACDASLRRAAAFAGAPPTGHFDLHEMVFRSDLRGAFCAAWRAWYAGHAPACDPVLGPTADDYMAWLTRRGPATATYALYDKHRVDAPSFAVQREVPPVDPRRCSLYGDAQRAALLSNFSGCFHLRTQAECRSASAWNCTWRVAVGSCYEDGGLLSPVTVRTVPASCAAHSGLVSCVLMVGVCFWDWSDQMQVKRGCLKMGGKVRLKFWVKLGCSRRYTQMVSN